MDTGRELFHKFLRGEPVPRPPFVPLVQGLAARVGGIPFETMNSDPTLWVSSLIKTVELFGLDGVVVGVDFTLMAEACGCEVLWKDDRPVISSLLRDLCEAPEETGRMRHALEAARRVFQVSRQERACVAAMTGPVTLARQLFGPEEGPGRVGEVKALVVQMTEAFCKTGPDLLLFMEGQPLGLAELNMGHRRIYNTLRNIASYYNIATGLYLEGYRPEGVAEFSALKLDIHILGPSVDKAIPSLSELQKLGAGGIGIGVGLPIEDLEEAREIINEGLSYAEGGPGIFFTSVGPLDHEVDLESLHRLVKEIVAVRL